MIAVRARRREEPDGFARVYDGTAEEAVAWAHDLERGMTATNAAISYEVWELGAPRVFTVTSRVTETTDVREVTE